MPIEQIKEKIGKRRKRNEIEHANTLNKTTLRQLVEYAKISKIKQKHIDKFYIRKYINNTIVKAINKVLYN